MSFRLSLLCSKHAFFGTLTQVTTRVVARMSDLNTEELACAKELGAFFWNDVTPSRFLPIAPSRNHGWSPADFSPLNLQQVQRCLRSRIHPSVHGQMSTSVAPMTAVGLLGYPPAPCTHLVRLPLVKMQNRNNPAETEYSDGTKSEFIPMTKQ